MRSIQFRKAAYVSFTLMILVFLTMVMGFASENSNIIPTSGSISYSPNEPTEGVIWGVNQYYGSGQYNIAINPTTLARARDAGLNTIVLWAWSPRTQDQIVSAATLMRQYGLEAWTCLPRVPSEASTLVQRLGSNCRYYEVLKEPHVEGYYSYATPTEYAQIWRDVVAACRQVNPNAWYGGPVVGSPRTSPRSVEWLQVWLQNCKDMINPSNTFISYHSFTCHGSTYTQAQLIERATSMQRDDLEEVRALCRQYLGYELKIAVSELQWTSAYEGMPRWDLDENFIRQWTTAAMTSLEQNGAWSVQFWWLGAGWDNTMSLLNASYNPKLQWYAIRDYLT